MKERILLIGAGGREHAIAKKLLESSSCEKLFCVPGNPGIAELCEIVSIDVGNHPEVSAWCRKNGITLVVVGPEQPLSEGISDALKSEGIPTFGPTQLAARIETSKEFSKNLMWKYGIPTASYTVFQQHEMLKALDFVAKQAYPLVIKASGLAAGKGVIIAQSVIEAQATISEIFGGAFGAAGSTIVVEEFLVGEEASLFAVTDGTNYVMLSPAQDHKKIGEGDTGKNTGGMGAYAPAPIVTPEVQLWAEENIIQPTLRAMQAEGCEFAGCLFAGLMIAPDGTSKVIEFNCRLGDPETQVVLSVLQGDLAGLFASVAHGQLDAAKVEEASHGHACCVILASGGYPDNFTKGQLIYGLAEVRLLENVIVYHAGTKQSGNHVVTAGGRVLGVTGSSDTLQGAVNAAYGGVSHINFQNMYFRGDIAKRGLGEE